ncbi:MAG: extracellular solute-binding protein [Spirochaetaceae bacterium]|nr:extracellular solute-binding protein [Spirochaetaceae bacterium]
MKKSLLIVTALLFPALAFAGGTKQPAATDNYMRLTWWGNTVRDEQTAKVADLFKSKNPGVTIDLEATGWGGYWDKVNTQAASGSAPDLMQQDYLYIGQWANRGQLLDLTPYVQDGTIDVSNIPDSVVASGKIGGKLYGIPLGTTIYCMAVDRAILEKAGIEQFDSTTWTWRDFERIAETVYQKTGVQTAPFGGGDAFPDAENYVRQSGVPFYAPDGKKLGFSDPALLKDFWDMELRLLDKGVLIPPSEAFVQSSMEESPLAKGRSWAMALWNTQVVAMVDAAGRPLELVFTPRIATGGYKRPGAFLKPSMFFSITAKSESPALAAQFLNFFLNDAAANDIIGGERGVPVVAPIRDSLSGKIGASQKTAFAILSEAVAKGYVSAVDPPYPAKSGEVNTLLRDITVQVLNKSVSSAEGASRFITRANQILAE